MLSEVSKPYEGPSDLPILMQSLLRDAKVIDISIGVHRPDLRGNEAVQNLVRIAYRQGIQIGLFRAQKLLAEEANAYTTSLEKNGDALTAVAVKEICRRAYEAFRDDQDEQWAG